MIQQLHTPTTQEVQWAATTTTFEDSSITEDAFNRWLDARDARIIAAAEQRGAIKELRDVEASLIDWDVLRGDEPGTAEAHESNRIAAWAGLRAYRLEGNND